MSKLTKKYRSFIFDCDGVLLKSNAIKTSAFRDVAYQFGSEAANALVEYHIKNGGISRYKKFSYLLTNILGHKTTNELMVKQLTDQYAKIVYVQLLTCPVAQGLMSLRDAYRDVSWTIISGSSQTELRKIFSQRNLDHFFDGGIFGSPCSKDEIFSREMANGKILHPALYIGDSKYDHQAACRAGIDFSFVYEWTEFKEWQDYCHVHQIPYIRNIQQLIEGYGINN